MSQRFTTDDVAARERLDYWRDAICDVFVQLDCRSAQPRGFFGHLSSESLARVRVSIVDADAQHVTRGRRQLAKASEDDFLLSLQLAGTGLVRQDGRDAPLVPGAMALYASTRPYDLIFPRRFRQLVLQLPRALLRPAIGNADALTARTLAPHCAEVRLLTATLTALEADAANLSRASGERIAASVVQALAAALATLPQAATARDYDCKATARARICDYVAEHLDDPALSPAAIAAALGFSRQHVHRLFAGGDESLERYVWRRRLERVRADLLDPAQAALPIGELAARHGFGSAQHFSRAFRARYGVTAVEFRRGRPAASAPSTLR